MDQKVKHYPFPFDRISFPKLLRLDVWWPCGKFSIWPTPRHRKVADQNKLPAQLPRSQNSLQTGQKWSSLSETTSQFSYLYFSFNSDFKNILNHYLSLLVNGLECEVYWKTKKKTRKRFK